MSSSPEANGRSAGSAEGPPPAKRRSQYQLDESFLDVSPEQVIDIRVTISVCFHALLCPIGIEVSLRLERCTNSLLTPG
jgi:hypothetical protein